MPTAGNSITECADDDSTCVALACPPLEEVADCTTSQATTVRWIQRDDELAALEHDWDALAGDVPFRTWQWMECWWRHYNTRGDRLCVLTVRDARQRLIGIVPWYLHRGLAGRRVLRFLGTREVCSDYLSLVCADEVAPRVARAAANWLMDAAPPWDIVELMGVEKGDTAVTELSRLMTERGCPIDAAPDGNCWRVSLNDDWTDYLARLSKARRERTRGMMRKLFDAGRAVQHVAVDNPSLERAFDILVDLHQKRRTSLGEPGCFASRQFTEFHRDVSARMLRAGKLRLGWTELDGVPIAAEYDFLGGRNVYLYQSGFETDVADVRPGWIGIAGSLRWAIGEGLEGFDFLRGDEPYKASWGGVARPLVQYRIVNRRASSRLRHTVWVACRSLKRWALRARAKSTTGPRTNEGKEA